MTTEKLSTSSICCIGEVMIELVHAPNGALNLGVAGDTYNTAVYLMRQLRGTEITTSYVTALGEDLYSDRIAAALESHGLDLSLVERRADKMPGLYAVDTDDQGERSFSYWRDSSAARDMFSTNSTLKLSALAGFGMVYLSGITMAILQPDARQKVLDFIQAYRASGGLFAYDSNYRPRLWESQEEAQKVNESLWRVCDIALPSIDDEMALFGDADEASVLRRLASFGVSQGALKRGAEGPLDLEGLVVAQNLNQVEKVIDSTAAGDSFNAGYLAAFLKGEGTQAALEAGHNLAAKVISARGAIIAE
ncbi:sugar kinase [Cognatishimia sp. WU-CL00825]|uniref:sugar kinase n=1 Tax=Cognatishimia sp. WU-CL00825 TaxID=3127658 RepID=UPI0031092F65